MQGSDCSLVKVLPLHSTVGSENKRYLKRLSSDHLWLVRFSNPGPLK